MIPPVILQADARTLPLPDDSVDLVCTSPPYFALRSYEDGGQHMAGQIGDEPTPNEYVDALLDCMVEWLRVLKRGGSIFVNLGDKYAERSGPPRAGGIDDDHISREANRPKRGRRDVRVKSLMLLPQRFALRCIDDLGLIVRQELVWSKPNPMPESVTDRAKRAHEQVWHIVAEPNYYADLDPIREPYSEGTIRQYVRSGYGASVGDGTHPSKVNSGQRVDAGAAVWKGNPLGKVPSDVWRVAAQPLDVPDHLGVDHFAAWPPQLVDRLVQGWCPPGGVVLDPFGGSGTTALVASVRGRRGISADLSHDYSRIARWRTTDPGERARAMGVSKPEAPISGQLDLLGGLV